MPIKVVPLHGVYRDGKQVYFDSEFVRVGPAATGVPLDEYLQQLDQIKRMETLDALLQAGFRPQVYALLMCDRYTERPSLQQWSDINSVDVKINRDVKAGDYVKLVARINALLRAGLVRLNNTGALVIATKPTGVE